ncbi:S-formylglutathione hydrolase [Galdieria sulphuraria]|nr:S-formylglutathione hydrolase [Galdieria sulphuraria]
MQHSIHQLSSSKCFGATVERYSHISPTLGNTSAKFHVIVPPQIKDRKVPVLYFLAGLTCNDETFVLYSGAQRYAAFYGILVVCPDTSPRDTGIEGEDREYNFGSSAGFYVNATTQPWNKCYHMFDYVTKELPEVICSNFNVDNTRQSIFGHSMGGHGALICALKNPTQYLSVSAFAPVSNPLNCSFGRKCLRGYLGNDKESWKQYDATELIKEKGPQFSDIFIDQGTLDPFLKDQLLVENFHKACDMVGQKLTLRMRQGYDHEYNFISTFIHDHFAYHNLALSQKPNASI